MLWLPKTTCYPDSPGERDKERKKEEKKKRELEIEREEIDRYQAVVVY
jgi:hypothetical protein